MLQSKVTLIYLALFLMSCQNSSKEETVHKHEVEIKPIEIKMKVDVTVGEDKDTKDEAVEKK